MDNFAEKVGFLIGGFIKDQIAGRIFQQHLPAQVILHLIAVGATQSQEGILDGVACLFRVAGEARRIAQKRALVFCDCGGDPPVVYGFVHVWSQA